MYCRVKDLKEAYKDTELNLVYAFDAKHPERLDPAAAQWFVYWLRKQSDESVTLASVEGYEETELAEAVTAFFRPPAVKPMSGSPISTSDSAG